MATRLTPNPLESDAQHERYYHLDIPYLELDQIREELYALRPLLWGLPEGDWIRERVRKLEAERTRRRYGDKEVVAAKTKPKHRPVEGVKL